MKRAVLVIFSIILFLLSIPAIFAGILLTAWGAGGDSTLQSDPWRTQSTGYAIVSDSVDLEWDSDAADWFNPTLGVENQDSNEPVFVGIGPTQEVDQYLSGVEQTVVTSIGDDLRANRNVEVPGSNVPEPPTAQDFWMQQASGTGLQELELDALSGNYRLVAMNADGSRGVAIAVQGSLDLPFLLPAGIAVLIFGVLLLGLALLLLILGIRAKPAPARPVAPTAQYGAPQQSQTYAGQANQPYPGQAPEPYPGPAHAPYPGQAPPQDQRPPSGPPPPAPQDQRPSSEPPPPAPQQ